MSYSAPMPTDKPHMYQGTYCRGLACAFRRDHLSALALTTPPPPFGATLGAAGGSPYFCRGLGCPPKISHPTDLNEGGFVAACAQLAGAQAAPSAPATDEDSINRLVEGEETAASTAEDAGTGFEAACAREFPAEEAYCGAYADVLRAATAVSGLPAFASPHQACSATYAFVNAAKEAEVHLELAKASIQGMEKITVDKEGAVPQTQTMYQLAPPSGPLTAMEVPGDLFGHCLHTVRDIMKDKTDKTGSAYIRATREYCDDKAGATPDMNAGADKWRPDWKGSCEGMEQLVGYALRESLELDSGPLGEQEVCRRLFLSVGVVHRVDEMIKLRIPLLPEMQMMAPPGPPTMPPPVPLPVGPTLPPATDKGILSLMDTAKARVAEAKARLAKILAAQAPTAFYAQEAPPAAQGDAASVALPDSSSFDFESRSESALRLQRLRGIAAHQL